VRSTAGLAVALYILLGVEVLFNLVGSLGTAPRIIVTHTSVNVEWGGLAAFASLAGLAAAVVALVWIYRTVANVRATGVPMKHSPGWAVGCWFIPFANFVLPYFPMREAWTKSRLGSTALLAGWWAAWVTHFVAMLVLIVWGIKTGWPYRDQVPQGEWAEAPLPSGFQAFGVLVNLVQAVAAGLFAVVVARFTKAQAGPPTRVNPR